LFDSQFYGVPQRRRRVYIVGHIGDPSQFPLFLERDGLRGNTQEGNEPWEDSASVTASNISYAESSFGTYTEGVVGTLRASSGTHGGGSETLVREVVGTLNARDEKGVGNEYAENGKLVLTDSEGSSVNYRTFTKGRRAQNPQDDEVWNESDVSPTLNQFDVGDVRAATVVAYSISERSNNNTFSAIPVETAGTLSAHQPSVQSHHAQNFIVESFDEYNNSLGGELHHTLRAGTGQSTGVVLPPIVRRLTPLECERLQGFPDYWTDGQSDNRRYKQMGNAVTVNVSRAVGNFIMDSIKNGEKE